MKIRAKLHEVKGVRGSRWFFSYATVNNKGELLHPTKGIGRKGLRLAGPSVIGTLRLVDAGIWPQEDAALARAWLADRKVAGSDPVDYVLSGYLDGLAEKTLLGLGQIRPDAAAIVKKARHDYETDAKSRREERPDVIAKQLATLRVRNHELEEEKKALLESNASLSASNSQLQSTVAGLQASLEAALGGTEQPDSIAEQEGESRRRGRGRDRGLRP